MIVNKALIAAAVLLFTAPVVPALAHDDYGDRGYVRCLACPGSWRDHDGWRDHELSLKVGDGKNRKGGISWGCLTTPLLH